MLAASVLAERKMVPRRRIQSGTMSPPVRLHSGTAPLPSIGHPAAADLGERHV